MAIVTQGIRFGFRDAKGFIGRDNYWVTGDTTSGTFEADRDTVLGALGTALLALTNAAIQSINGPATASREDLAYGTNAQYPAEFMKAVMTFATNQGSISRFKIPAPKIALFDTDGVTILNDGTQAAVVAYVNAVKTAVNSVFISTGQGLAYAHFVGGTLRIGKQQKRHNQFIKSSHLVAGEGE